MGGVTAIRLIRQERPATEVVALTSVLEVTRGCKVRIDATVVPTAIHIRG
jgi:hypothetical protein